MKGLNPGGIIVPPGDAAAFAYAIVKLSEKSEEHKQSGMAAREFSVKELDRKKILSQFTQNLNSFTHPS